MGSNKGYVWEGKKGPKWQKVGGILAPDLEGVNKQECWTRPLGHNDNSYCYKFWCKY